MTSFLIGRHIGISGNFINVPHYARIIGCQIFQIFMGAPQQILSKRKTDDELIAFADNLKKYNIIMVIHGSYTVNLCHPSNSAKFKSSIKTLVQDLNSSNLIGSRCIGVIIHMGKNVNGLTNDVAINNYAIGVMAALDQSATTTRIILETGAHQGTEVASMLPDMAKIYKSIDSKYRKRVAFCIDTCHIWASGYDISTSKGVNKYFHEFDKLIGLNKIVCIHLNDSKRELGSKVDRHQDLGYGLIGEEGLAAVVRFAKSHDIPIIMETPLYEIDRKTNQEMTFHDEINLIKKWLK